MGRPVIRRRCRCRRGPASGSTRVTIGSVASHGPYRGPVASVAVAASRIAGLAVPVTVELWPVSRITPGTDDGQNQRVALNLTDWRGDPAALRRQFDSWPIDGLKELVAVTRDGTTVQIIRQDREGKT
ncbi:hypothetical protein GA0070617_0992 [Micromonospora yangpuensis]|uniref:Uncharacterized protein n=1 Tax=Micromonospora yangpuensis TaxID=683228 RepID=A0A1C6U4J5_9ACTN|nr:hypothetical protein GA0070617_0992 [Micromonospora yangpuensis]